MLGHSSLNHVYRTVWNEALGAMVAVAEHVSSHAGRAGRRVAVGAAPDALASQGALTPLAVVVALVCCAAALPVWANPQGGVAIHGQATFNTVQPNVLQVTTQNGAGTNHSAINWQSFSIPAGSTTQILQPNAASMSINRVVTNTPSVLFGSLQSNGQVVLVNQAGIAVGSGAVVDTAGFTASAVGMSAADAVLGRLRFAGDGFTGTSGALTVQGNIIARGGDVVLIAPSVEVAQSAVVESQGGSVVLAAGQSVEVTGRGLEGITLQVQAPSDQALNLGSLKGDAVGIFASTLKHSGQIQATTATLEGGRVVLKAAGDAYVQGSGRIDASSTTGKGGGIAVLGNRVAVMDNAVLDASGATGGGTVLVGGDYQGSNAAVQNASVTYVGQQTRIKADASGQGEGGRVIVWADGTTRYEGHISAQGGARGGNGGFVEVSGKGVLSFNGTVDTSASLGSKGTLLLDPTNVFIAVDQTAATAAGMLGSDISVDASAGAPTLYQSGGTPADSLLTTATLQAALASNNVEVNTSSGGSEDGNIVVASNVAKAAGTDVTLKLIAHNDIIIKNSVSISASVGALNVVLNADSDANGGAIVMNTGSSITSNGGSITLGGGSNPLANAAIGNAGNTSGVKLSGAALDAGAGNISVRGAGVGGIPNLNSGIEIGAGSSIVTTSGTITLNGTGGGAGGTYNNKYGIYLGGGTIQSGTGSISLNGTGGTAGTFSNIGVYLDGGLINSTGTASISITGNGGPTSSANNNYGVFLSGGAAGLTVSSVTGAISIDGTASGGSEGVRAFGGGQVVNVTSSGAAPINFNGAGAGTGSNSSFWLDGSSGAITIGGSSATGPIGFIAGGVHQDIALSSGVTIKSTGSLLLKPLNSSTTIGIGGVTGVFNIDALDLAALADGFSNITIGSGAHVGVLAVGGSTFNDNLSLLSGGGITFAGSLTSAGNAIELSGGGGGIAGGANTITGDKLRIVSSGNVSLIGPNMVNSLAADLNSSGTLDFRNNQSLTIANIGGTNGIDFSNNAAAMVIKTTSGDLTVNAPVNAGPMGGGVVVLNAFGTLALNAPVTSSFNSDPGGPVRLIAGAGGITSTASGAITASALEVISAGSVVLDAATNDLRSYVAGGGILAGNVTGSGFSFANSGAFQVGTSGTVGLTVASGDVFLKTGASNQLLTINQNVQSTSGSVSYTTDNLAHNASTTTSVSPGKFVEVRPFTAATVIEFSAAADDAGVLRLSSGELGFVTPMLKLGHNSNTGGISFAQAVTPANFNTLSLITGGVISQTTSGALTIANLNADGAAGVDLSTASPGNSVTKLAGHTTSGNFLFKNSGALNLGAVDIMNGIDAGINDVMLQSGGALTDSAGTATITANTLTLQSSGGVLLDANHAISIFNAASSGGNIYLTNTKPTLTIGSVAQNGGGMTRIENTGNIALGAIDGGTAVVTLRAHGGNITDNNSSADNVFNAFRIDFNDASSTNPGGVGTFADPIEVYHATGPTNVTAWAKNGGIYLQKTSGTGLLDLQGITHQGTSSFDIDIKSNTGIVNNAGFVTTSSSNNGNVLLESAGAGGVALNAAINKAGAGFIKLRTTGAGENIAIGSNLFANAGDVVIESANHVSGSNSWTISGQNLTITAAGDINFDTGASAGSALQFAGTSALTAGSSNFIKANNTGNDFGGVVGVISAMDVSLADANALVLGNLSHGGNLLVTAGGAVSGIGVIAGSNANISAVGGINLTGDNTAAVVTMNNQTSGSIMYKASYADGLTVGGVTNTATTGGGDITVGNAVGGVTLTSAVSAAATGSVITVASYGNFFNNVGSSALAPGAGGYWLVYSTDPTSDSPNGLLYDFKHYNQTFTGSAYAGPGVGNGFLYSFNPSLLTPVLTGPITKTYDGTTTVSTAGLPLSATGTSFSDVVTLSATAAAFNSKNVGLGTTVTATGIAFASAVDSATKPVYGYGVSSSTASASGTITAAALGINAVTDSKTYDGGTSSAGVVTFSGLVGGDTVTGAIQSFASKNVLGAGGSTLAASGYTVNDGNGGANYSVTTNTATGAITAAALGINAVTDSKTYDGTVAYAVVSGDLSALTSALLGGDTVSAATMSYADKNAGASNKTVNLNSVALNDGNGGLNYSATLVGNSASTIIAKAVTLTAPTFSKTYDGGLTYTTTAGDLTALAGSLLGGDSVTAASMSFADRNVGAGNKVVALNSIALNDGNGGANYSVTLAGNTNSTIQMRPMSTWVGPTTGLWSNAGNWDALPDGTNVLAVSIPSGTNVVYDAAVGSTTLQSLSSAGTFGLSGGNLSVANSVNTAQFSQTGGALSGAGTFTVTNSFSQTGGTVSMGGKVTVDQAAGNLIMSSVSAPAVQLGAASGNIDFTNVGVIDIQGLKAANGNITVNNTGGISTSGIVMASNGTVSMTANSPLTIGAAGVSASGDITLIASNLTSAGDLTLNGPVVSSGGVVTLTGANSLVQNSAVSAATQVLARAQVAMSFGTSATSDGASVVYELGGVAVQAPPSSVTVTALQTQAVVALASMTADMSGTLEALVTGPEADPTDPDEKSKDGEEAIVVEGEICKK